jgi:DNA-binding response OmpR family regulator
MNITWRLLIVEDDQRSPRAKDKLEAEGYEVSMSHAEDCLRLLETSTWTLVVLDLMLPASTA